MSLIPISVFLPPEALPETDPRLQGVRQISITVPAWVLAQLDGFVEEFDHLSRSGVISQILEEVVPDLVQQLQEIQK